MSEQPTRGGAGRRRAALCAAIAVATATGCASKPPLASESEVAALRLQLDELKKGQESAARELQRLSGELKARDAQSEFLVGEAKTASGALGQMKAKLDEAERAIGDLRSSVEALGRQPPPVAVTPPPVSPPPQTLATTPPSSVTQNATAEEMFASAMASFQAEEHGQAVLEWAGLTQKYPEHPLAASAQYWIGEAYYRQRDFPQAVVEFRKVIDGYPQSPQVPEALLKIGMCYRAVDDTARARDTWEQLIKEFPASNASSQARSLLGGGTPSARPAR